MSEQSKKRLDRLINITEADTSAEVIKNALRLYEAIINKVMNDEEFLVRNKKTGDITIYSLFENIDIEERKNTKPAARPTEHASRRADPQPVV
jgi:hypothetical protein